MARELFKRLDYNKQFAEMQHDLRGSPKEEKLSYYKDFYKAIAKSADQRLVNLERLSQKEGYESVKEWAYKLAMYDIHSSFGPNAKRFNRKQPDDLRTVYKNIRNVLRFLDEPTSSKQGIDEVYQKRANTIRQRYNINVNWQSIAGLFESKLYEKTDTKLGSQTVLKALGVIQRNTHVILKALDDKKSIAVRMGNKFEVVDEEDKKVTIYSDEKYDAAVEDVVNRYLRYYKKDVKYLFRGF